MHICTYLHLIS